MTARFRAGYGTHTVRIDVMDHGAYADTIAAALEIGYRHVDTSPHAGTEQVVGEALRRSGVDAAEVTVATKVHLRDLAPADVRTSIERSRERLGREVLDVLYVHAPLGAYDPAATLAAFDQAVADGVVHHVGVCHFTPAQLEAAIERLEAPLFAHQVERHPLLPQRELLAMARAHGHWLVSASPLLRGAVGEIREVREVADRRGWTPVATTLAWHHADPCVATVSHTLDAGHLRENLSAVDAVLDPADLSTIDAIDRRWRLHAGLGA